MINEDVGLTNSRQVSVKIVMKIIRPFAHAFQVSVDHLIGMKMLKATHNANQLSVGNENHSADHRRAGKLTRRMRSTP